MITKIQTHDLRGHSLDIALEQFTAIGGPHGSGKTSLIMAAHFALRGYYPGDDKRGDAIMANCAGDVLGAAVELEGHRISRRWTKGGKGAISQTVTVDGAKGAANAADGMIRLALGHPPAIFDSLSFWGLSDRETRKEIIRLTAGDKAEAMLELDAKPRERLNKARADRLAAEKALASTGATLAALPPLQGDLGRIREKVAADKASLAEIRERIATGEQADQERTRCLRQVEAWGGGREDEQKALKAEWDDLQGREATQRPEVPAAIAPLPKWARSELQKIVETFDGCEGHAAEIYDVVKSILLTEARNETAVAQSQNALAEWDEAERKVSQKRVSISARLGELKQQATNARAARDRLAKLPPSPAPEDRQAAVAIEQRLVAAEKTLQDAARRAQVAEMMEKQRQEAERLATVEAEAKEALYVASKTMAEALISGVGALRERCAKILPTGELYVIADEDKTRLGWHREGKGFVPRAALSGSEKVIFDAAIAYAMLGDGCTAFLDAGEVGNDALATLAGIKDVCPCQVVLCRWTDSKIKLPKMDGWKVIELE